MVNIPARYIGKLLLISWQASWYMLEGNLMLNVLEQWLTLPLISLLLL